MRRLLLVYVRKETNNISNFFHVLFVTIDNQDWILRFLGDLCQVWWVWLNSGEFVAFFGIFGFFVGV